jgi:23S rRNA pseudouridine1911/1915/1917 synthase
MVAILTPEEEANGQKPTVTTRKSLKLEKGTKLHVKHAIDEIPTEIVAQNLPLSILYEDEHMIVLNKAAGMVVHPAIGNWDNTIVNALAYYLANESPFGSGDFIENDGKVKPDKAEGVDVDGTDGEVVTFRPGIVHRLDKGTTGILVVAKTRESLTTLSESFANREVKKTYVAVTVGNPGKRVVIDKPIGRHPIHRQRMRVVPDPSKMNSSGMSLKERRAAGMGSKSTAVFGRNALSFVDTLAFDGKLGVAQVRIETGRTHQIRGK